MTAIQLNTKEYITEAKSNLVKTVGEINAFSYPNIAKITVNVGVGKFKEDSKFIDEIANYLLKLTGQKAKLIKSKKSIAGFKLRSGNVVGLQVTLRGEKMYDFLLNLVYVALPRGRDFKGISSTAFDKNFQTYSIGIRSATIFPAVGFDLEREFGLQINITFKHSSPNNFKLLESLKLPFQTINTTN